MIKHKTSKLSHEILGLTAVSALLALVLYYLLSVLTTAALEMYIFQQDLVLTEFQWLELDSWVLRVSLIVSVGFFTLLFLFLLGDRLAYIRQITEGIHALQAGEQDHALPLVGRNELTQLADAINTLSAAQRQLREKEAALNREKEQFIRTLSHDIRTPLTSLLAYSEYLSGQEQISPHEQAAYCEMVAKKASQIRDLTDLLLDGGKRNPELFEDARLLMEQLAAEFEESLEDSFRVATDLTGCPAFSGTFDVQELRRIFDNLVSNIQKYADPQQPVRLNIRLENRALAIRQENGVLPAAPETQSYKLGIHSIRRIAQNYGGQVALQTSPDHFEISITLSDF